MTKRGGGWMTVLCEWLHTPHTAHFDPPAESCRMPCLAPDLEPGSGRPGKLPMTYLLCIPRAFQNTFDDPDQRSVEEVRTGGRQVLAWGAWEGKSA